MDVDIVKRVQSMEPNPAPQYFLMSYALRGRGLNTGGGT